MKKIVLFAVLVSAVISSCKNNKPSAKAGSVDRLIPRDLSINSNNAYTTLFLDSIAVEKFITQQNINDTLSNSIRNFYNSRNYQFAWFAKDGLTEQAYGFRSLYDYSKDSDSTNKSLDARLDALMAEDNLTISGSDANIIKTELLFTWRYMQYLWDTYSKTSARSTALLQLVPAKKSDILQRAETVLADKTIDDITSSRYNTLRDQLAKYVDIAKKGGWPVITTAKKKYATGASDPSIGVIKKRLQITGQLPGNDTTTVFDASLENAVKNLQASFGYKPDGILTTTLINEMNVPAIKRVEQILINLERMKWIPEATNGKLILVNIPEFKLHVWEGKSKALDMDIVVGKEGHNTTLFSGSLNQVVFSPYWNLPPDIVRKEVMPDMEQNGNYLQEHNMEITGERNGLPVIRQLPGDKNELGKVKFVFPNTFNIYFHDTPHKDLFKRDKRAYSHGCIRLSNPVQLANYLLKDESYWTPEKIDSAMNSGKEKYVRVKEPVPVLINYYTAWVDENGLLQFREDIYGHDKKLAEKLFINPA
jgi:murein L,D-transpeptidase YcbB/YkuD